MKQAMIVRTDLKNDISRRLASLFPITTTSANLSDEEVLSNPDDILEQLDFEVLDGEIISVGDDSLINSKIDV